MKYHSNGTYTATFTGTTAGSNTMTATISSQAVTSTQTITVTSGPDNEALLAASVPTPEFEAVGGAVAVALQTEDTQGNDETIDQL